MKYKNKGRIAYSAFDPYVLTCIADIGQLITINFVIRYLPYSHLPRKKVNSNIIPGAPKTWVLL